jgi:2-keto-4-pentenoate hydratase
MNSVDLSADIVSQAADRLLHARTSGQTCTPVRDLLGDHDIESAYRAQGQTIQALVRGGRRVVGAKIGLTAPAVQRQFGVHQPDFGMILDDTVLGHGETIAIDKLMQPRAEGEIAFVLGRDLDRPNVSVADVLRATDFILPAIEIVDSRISNWDLTITDTVADNASSGCVVLGATPISIRERDLAGVGMTLCHNGEPVSFGAGHACLGSPVVAVAWLARTLAELGQSLPAGSLVLSGALGPMVGLDAGRLTLNLDGIGSVEAIAPARPDADANPGTV